MSPSSQEQSEHLLRTPFGKATQVPVKTFVDKVLPPLRADICFDELVDLSLQNPGGRLLLPITRNGRLWGYSSKKPSEVSGPRSSTFRSLLVCASRVARAVKGSTPTLIFRNNDRSQWDLRKRDEDALPDAYLLGRSLDARSHSQDAVDWTSIAIPGVYSKFRTERTAEDNTIKISRCMSQCMSRDARRRFVYGFSVEDSTMTFCYCDRAKIIFSEPFNFVEDWRTLFRFLLSVMFAEREQLGFDPTMTLFRQDDGTVQYDILVRSDTGETQLFRTLEILSEVSEDRLRGHGTRVWKAVRVQDGIGIGDPVALKDCWVDHYREREGFINARIRASATSEHQRQVLGKSLLTVLIHGDVFVSDARDCTASYLRRDVCIQDVAVGTDNGARGDGVSNTDHHLQVHYRVVFKEIGQPLRDVTSLKVAFKALKDVTNGLSVMHECGWTHGDLSTGNILLYGDWAKISDLEYAVQKDERKKHDRMGTEYFASVEVRSNFYLFIPGDWQRKEALEDNAARSCTPPPTTGVGAQSPASAIKSREAQELLAANNFLYNPLHDLESLWWIAVFLIVTREVINEDGDGDEDDSPDRAEAQRKLASDFFWDRGKRVLAVTNSTYFSKRLDCLHSSVIRIAWGLEGARRYLVQRYRKAEWDITTIQFEIAGDVHQKYAEFFESLVELLTPHDIQIHPFEDEE